MSSQTITAVKPTRDGTVVLDGFGISVTVDRGHLSVSDGIGRQRRQARFSRATSRLKRLIVLGHSGWVSLDALRWLTDTGASFTQVDLDGRVLVATGTRRLNEAKLRRAAALASGTEKGLQLGRWIIEQKLDGQEKLLKSEFGATEAAVAAFARSRVEVENANSPRDLLRAEALAAGFYWAAWRDLPVAFVARDQARVPAHWLVFGSRSSPLTGTPRRAANPANAMLNYLYAILEAESTVALWALGLDPGLGLIHADQVARASLACDVMEAVRIDVDRHALPLIRSRLFRAKDFAQERDGGYRLSVDLARELAAAAGHWANIVAPVVEELARRLLGPSGSRLPTVLTADRRSDGQNPHRERPRGQVKLRTARWDRCENCGEPAGPQRRFCSDCQPARQVVALRRLRESSADAWTARHALGSTIPQSGRDALADHRRREAVARREWDQTHGTADVDRYWSAVFPAVVATPVRQLAKRSKLSLGYCSKLRRGLSVPHARHWSPLMGGAPD